MEKQEIGRMKVLIVEDNELIRSAIARAITEYFESRYDAENLTVLTANDGEEGLGVFHKNQDTTLVIGDWDMPNMDGLQMFEMIRDIRKVATVMYSSRTDSKSERQVMESGAVDCLVTKGSMRPLLDAIEVALRKHGL